MEKLSPGPTFDLWAGRKLEQARFPNAALTNLSLELDFCVCKHRNLVQFSALKELTDLRRLRVKFQRHVCLEGDDSELVHDPCNTRLLWDFLAKLSRLRSLAVIGLPIAVFKAPPPLLRQLSVSFTAHSRSHSLAPNLMSRHLILPSTLERLAVRVEPAGPEQARAQPVSLHFLWPMPRLGVLRFSGCLAALWLVETEPLTPDLFPALRHCRLGGALHSAPFRPSLRQIIRQREDIQFYVH